MKIRTQFALMVLGMILIPLILVEGTRLYWSLSQPKDRVPTYSELSAFSRASITEKEWTAIADHVQNRPGGSHVAVLDGSFRIIWSTMGGKRFEPGTNLVAGEVTTVLPDFRQIQDVILYHPAGTAFWFLVIQDSHFTTINFIQNLITFFGLGLLVMLVFSVLFSVAMGTTLTRSIGRLEKAARRMADGDLDDPIHATGNTEIRSLGQTFEQLRLALREENARQSRFVMGVSHDLKSPLTLIKGYVELIKDGPATGAVARDAHFDLILDKVDQLDGMIDHLIDYSKVNTGEWQATWKTVGLRALLEEFLRDVTPDAKLLGKSIEADLQLPPGLAVDCDPRSIRRCLENLANNALRYTGEGGKVGVSARATAEGVEVTVWDNGPGIAAADLPHVFELFYRGTHSRRESGMGLGLSIVKTILDSHGWTIRGNTDGGARFTISIPASSKSEGTAGP